MIRHVGNLSLPGFLKRCRHTDKWERSIFTVAALFNNTSERLKEERTAISQNGDEQKQPQRPKMVIFDKNGTLIDFHSTWTPWVQDFVKRLQQKTKLKVEDALYREFNFCGLTSKTRDGLLAQATMEQLKNKVVETLMHLGLTEREAHTQVEACWYDKSSQNVHLAHKDLELLFKQLKLNKVKIAVCTADTRKDATRNLTKLRLLDYIDEMICCDDKEYVNKPEPSNVEMLCKRLDIVPSETVFVGDTSADLLMGQRAKVASTIGVLSGIGSRLDLSPYSNYVVDSVMDIVPIVLPQEKMTITEDLFNDAEAKQRAGLVIFDKDGTLLCFHSMWTPWAQNLVTELCKETGLDVEKKVLNRLGFCDVEGIWRPGIFAEGTQKQNMDAIVEVLKEEGLSRENAIKIVDKVWSHADHGKGVKILDDPAKVFRILKQFGVKVAICTSDSRVGTEQFIETLGVSDCVDMMVCGDDEDAQPKPSPYNALKICHQLNVDPAKTVHVGDTIADIQMGRKANLGAAVGVLCGVGDVQYLDHGGADHVIHNISDILPIALNVKNETVKKVLKEYHSSLH